MQEAIIGLKYWCTVCNEVHSKIEGSDEFVTKTGWAFVSLEGRVMYTGEKLSIGFCNGLHREGKPIHMYPAGVMPVFESK